MFNNEEAPSITHILYFVYLQAYDGIQNRYMINYRIFLKCDFYCYSDEPVENLKLVRTIKDFICPTNYNNTLTYKYKELGYLIKINLKCCDVIPAIETDLHNLRYTYEYTESALGPNDALMGDLRVFKRYFAMSTVLREFCIIDK